MKKKDEEFKPTVIEPIEGQMRYDELLLPVQEEKKEETPIAVDGQLDMWSISKENKTQRKTKLQEKNDCRRGL